MKKPKYVGTALIKYTGYESWIKVGLEESKGRAHPVLPFVTRTFEYYTDDLWLDPDCRYRWKE